MQTVSFSFENESYPMLRNIVAYPKIRLLKERMDSWIFDGRLRMDIVERLDWNSVAWLKLGRVISRPHSLTKVILLRVSRREKLIFENSQLSYWFQSPVIFEVVFHPRTK